MAFGNIGAGTGLSQRMYFQIHRGEIIIINYIIKQKQRHELEFK